MLPILIIFLPKAGFKSETESNKRRERNKSVNSKRVSKVVSCNPHFKTNVLSS